MKPIIKLLHQDIPFLDTTKNRLILIGIICTYSYIFINIYDPYDINVWAEDNYLEFILWAFGVLLVSQFPLRALFKISSFKVYSLMLWGLMEMVLIALVFEWAYSPQLPSTTEMILAFLITLKQVVFVTIIPYTVVLWYAQIQRKLQTYKTAKNDTENLPPTKNNELLILHGENNKVVLAIKYPQLLYIKSAGNYLELFYMKGEKLTKELVRMSFKELEGKIHDPNVLRIHRSYIVNTIHISSFKKTKKGYAVHVQHITDEVIPVSSGYRDPFEESLQRNGPVNP